MKQRKSACIYLCVYIPTYTYSIYIVCVYVYTYIYIYIYVCMYISYYHHGHKVTGIILLYFLLEILFICRYFLHISNQSEYMML